MRLGVNLGYWGAGNDADNLALAVEAERLGYSVVWAAEAYGSDAATVLAWIAAHTSTIDVGSAIFQIPGRTPALSAMTAATLDTLSGGRFRLGLGVSGPQVSEGWHGVRFDKPLGRTREYVEIVRLALSREKVQYDGTHWTLPLPDGPGKALRLTVHPARENIPVYLAAVGPKNLELTGEIADGWLAIFFAPEYAKDSLGQIRAGQDKAGRTEQAFDVVPTVPVVVGADVQACAEPVRHYAALVPSDLRAKVTPGMPEVLEALARTDRRLSLVTGNLEPIARLKLRAAGLGSFFARGQGGFGSDHEDRTELPAVARARAGHGARAPWPRERTVVIGDTPRDIACARADGVRCVAVTTGPFGAADLRDADAVAADPAQLAATLDELA